jgi:3',5'-cyclic-nucleotide phosphodiesterase
MKRLDDIHYKSKDDQRRLLCGMLLKCADISNVARKYDVAKAWAKSLNDEFAEQRVWEREHGIPTSLPQPEAISYEAVLPAGQSAFIKLFALPLFEAVAQLVPELDWSVSCLLENQRIWEGLLQQDPLLPSDVSQINKPLAPGPSLASAPGRALGTVSVVKPECKVPTMQEEEKEPEPAGNTSGVERPTRSAFRKLKLWKHHK